MNRLFQTLRNIVEKPQPEAEDVSAGEALPGFDNRLEGAVHEPALTSVHIPLFNVGYRAVGLFLQHLAGKAELSGTVKVDTRLVVRESCMANHNNSQP